MVELLVDRRALLPARPWLKPWYQRVTTDDGVLLTHGESIVVFEGRAATRLLPVLLELLDGSLTVEEIVAAMGEPVRPATLRALGQLAERDLLLDGDRAGAEDEGPDTVWAADSATAMARATGGTPRAVRQALAGAWLHLVGEGPLAVELARLTRLAGVGRVTQSLDAELHPASLTVVAPPTPAHPVLHEQNALALEHGVPWMLVLPHDGRFATVGPLVVPGATACYRCFELRRAANLGFRPERERFDAAVAGGAPTAGGASGGPLATLVAALAAHDVLDLLQPERREVTPLAGAFTAVSVDFGGVHTDRHRLFRVPRCPACSRTAGRGHPQPWHELLPAEVAALGTAPERGSDPHAHADGHDCRR